MKKLIVKVLCFSILFNSFICIMSKTAYAIENYNQKTTEQNKDEEDKWEKYVKNVDKKKAGIFTAVAIGVGTSAFLIFKHMRKVPTIVNNPTPEFEEEEQEISDGAM